MMVKSIFYFVLAGLCEIGGGYLVWQWLREGKSGWLAVLGAVILVLYGGRHSDFSAGPLRPPLRSLWWHFYRDGASVGLACGQKISPDRIDVIGSAIALMGVAIMMYWPRTAA